jgi:hypothetical protein
VPFVPVFILFLPAMRPADAAPAARSPAGSVPPQQVASSRRPASRTLPASERLTCHLLEL